MKAISQNIIEKSTWWELKYLYELRLEEPDCGKLTSWNSANTDALKKMEILQTLAKSNENLIKLTFCNFEAQLLNKIKWKRK
jgi:hypothetical protein